MTTFLICILIMAGVALLLGYRPKRCPRCRAIQWLLQKTGKQYVSVYDEDVAIEIVQPCTCRKCRGTYMHIWNDLDGQWVTLPGEAPVKASAAPQPATDNPING